MKLEEFIEYVLNTQLSSLYIADKGLEKFTEKELTKMVSVINSNLVELFTKFPLKVSTVLLQSIEWKSTYELDSKYSFIHGTEDIRYIVDSAFKPFTNDIIKIIGVTNEVGSSLPLNDAEQWASVFTPSYNVIQLTHPGACQVFEIAYQASHPVLSIDNLEESIEVTPTIKELLSMMVAREYFSNMSGQEITNKYQMLDMKINEILTTMKTDNLLNMSDVVTNVKLHRRGFP